MLGIRFQLLLQLFALCLDLFILIAIDLESIALSLGILNLGKLVEHLLKVAIVSIRFILI